jgi:hypothetical protein
MQPSRSGAVAKKPPRSSGGNGSITIGYSSLDILLLYRVDKGHKLSNIYALYRPLVGNCPIPQVVPFFATLRLTLVLTLVTYASEGSYIPLDSISRP